MHATLDLPLPFTPTVSQADPQRAADAYLTHTLGAGYSAVSGVYEHECWSFLIRWHRATLPQPCIVGRVSVRLQEALGRVAVIPLTEDQLREVRECADWERARVQGELARDASGYVSRHQARRLARRWLDRHLALKYDASGGILLPLATPIWQFSICFGLQELHLEPLGVIDVDAQTGEVKPLKLDQLENLRERVCAVIQHNTPTATA
jgi:hypothetical protein